MCWNLRWARLDATPMCSLMLRRLHLSRRNGPRNQSNLHHPWGLSKWALFDLCRLFYFPFILAEQCGPNESWNLCSNNCRSCSLFLNQEECDPDDCVEGCQCHEGFYKTDDGKCVNLQQCYDTQCSVANEVYTHTSAGCELTCKNPDPAKLVCNDSIIPGCICGKGFARDDNGKCVKVGDCPREQEIFLTFAFHLNFRKLSMTQEHVEPTRCGVQQESQFVRCACGNSLKLVVLGLAHLVVDVFPATSVMTKTSASQTLTASQSVTAKVKFTRHARPLVTSNVTTWLHRSVQIAAKAVLVLTVLPEIAAGVAFLSLTAQSLESICQTFWHKKNTKSVNWIKFSICSSYFRFQQRHNSRDFWCLAFESCHHRHWSFGFWMFKCGKCETFFEKKLNSSIIVRHQKGRERRSEPSESPSVCIESEQF
jgi:Trypsin Inhibitor like cysteine rich domain